MSNYTILDTIYIFTPIILSCFFILLSILNENIKGIIFILGAIIAIVSYVYTCSIINFQCPPEADLICNTFGLPFKYGTANTSGSSILFILYTFVYILIPMIVNKHTNVYFLIIMLLLLVVNIYASMVKKCVDIWQLSLASLFGLFFGFIWYLVISYIDNGLFLYYDELDSNNVQCKRPTNDTFKCTVYRNGQIDNSGVM